MAFPVTNKYSIVNAPQKMIYLPLPGVGSASAIVAPTVKIVKTEIFSRTMLQYDLERIILSIVTFQWCQTQNLANDFGQGEGFKFVSVL